MSFVISTAIPKSKSSLIIQHYHYHSSFSHYMNIISYKNNNTIQTTTTRSKSSKSKNLPHSSLPLGHPLPLDEHACSVSLPTWSSVVGYEEGLPQVTQKLACGYPRFVYHPYIIQLMNVSLDLDSKLQRQHVGQGGEGQEWDCIVLPTRDSALRCHDFLVKACGYHDGKAASPRLVHSNLSHIVGTCRIPLFSHDNAINVSISRGVGSNGNMDCYNPNSPIRVLDLNISAGVHAVIFPAQTVFAIEAKSYWQHTGEVLSSRRAEAALQQLQSKQNHPSSISSTGSGVLSRVTSSFHCDDSNHDHDWKKCPFTNQYHLAFYPSECDKVNNDNTDNNINPYDGIKDRIASIVGISSSNVFLTPSGMASIYAALRSARRRKIMSSSEKEPTNIGAGGGASVVFGFPYLDTLKMCSRPELVPDGVEFFGHGNEQDLNNLESMLKERKKRNDPDVSVLITEFPSNPLLHCPDLHKLRSLADQYDFAIVVDDTIGNFANLDLIQSGLADAVCTSLTKLFNGRGDAMAGSVITNPNTKIGRWIQCDLVENHRDHEGLWAGDAYAVNSNSVDFLSRSSQINKTTESLADWLRERDEVAAVYYPKFTCPSIYNACLNASDYGGTHKAGYGGLFSILLHPHICQRTFYDKLDLSKGPSLGTDFSLVCPYTLLAHYHELDFAMSYDVQPNLLRFAIGLEDLETLKTKFTTALQESKLHPKLPSKPPIGANMTTARGLCTHARANSPTYYCFGVGGSWNEDGGMSGRTIGVNLSHHKPTPNSRLMSSCSKSGGHWNEIDMCNAQILKGKIWRRNICILHRAIILLR